MNTYCTKSLDGIHQIKQTLFKIYLILIFLQSWMLRSYLFFVFKNHNIRSFEILFNAKYRMILDKRYWKDKVSSEMYQYSWKVVKINSIFFMFLWIPLCQYLNYLKTLRSACSDSMSLCIPDNIDKILMNSS